MSDDLCAVAPPSLPSEAPFRNRTLTTQCWLKNRFTHAGTGVSLPLSYFRKRGEEGG